LPSRAARRGGPFGQLAGYVARRPDTVGTALIVAITAAVYLFTAERERQDFDYSSASRMPSCTGVST
jgi:hypothetical protein